MADKKMIVAGGSGFLGRTLANWFSSRGYAVVGLSRTARDFDSMRTVVWDAQSIGPWAEELDSANVLINLAGRSVNCRYTAANRKAMMDSRVFSTRVLSTSI